jgi:hypothetical protein
LNFFSKFWFINWHPWIFFRRPLDMSYGKNRMKMLPINFRYHRKFLPIAVSRKIKLLKSQFWPRKLNFRVTWDQKTNFENRKSVLQSRARAKIFYVRVGQSARVRKYVPDYDRFGSRFENEFRFGICSDMIGSDWSDFQHMFHKMIISRVQV